jgi:hypothetical protein
VTRIIHFSGIGAVDMTLAKCPPPSPRRVSRRSPPAIEHLSIRTCPTCRSEFWTTDSHKFKYCTVACRYADAEAA